MNFEDVAGRLKILRGDLSQKKFAQFFNVGQTYISEIELGKVKPSLEFLSAVSTHFSITIDYILNGDKAPAPQSIEVNNRMLHNISSQLTGLFKEVNEIKSHMGHRKTA